MKKTVTLLFILAAGALLIFFILNDKTPVKLTESLTAPTFEVINTATGQKVSLQSLKNKVVFVNFWATWCPPCREEMPSIEALYRDLAGNQNFAMITILYKDDPKTASDYMKSLGYTFGVYTDPDYRAASSFGVTGVPETYIMDKRGVLRKKIIGPADWNSPDAKALISLLLNE